MKYGLSNHDCESTRANIMVNSNWSFEGRPAQTKCFTGKPDVHISILLYMHAGINIFSNWNWFQRNIPIFMKYWWTKGWKDEQFKNQWTRKKRIKIWNTGEIRKNMQSGQSKTSSWDTASVLEEWTKGEKLIPGHLHSLAECNHRWMPTACLRWNRWKPHAKKKQNLFRSDDTYVYTSWKWMKKWITLALSWMKSIELNFNLSKAAWRTYRKKYYKSLITLEKIFLIAIKTLKQHAGSAYSTLLISQNLFSLNVSSVNVSVPGVVHV